MIFRRNAMICLVFALAGCMGGDPTDNPSHDPRGPTVETEPVFRGGTLWMNASSLAHGLAMAGQVQIHESMAGLDSCVQFQWNVDSPATQFGVFGILTGQVNDQIYVAAASTDQDFSARLCGLLPTGNLTILTIANGGSWITKLEAEGQDIGSIEPALFTANVRVGQFPIHQGVLAGSATFENQLDGLEVAAVIPRTMAPAFAWHVVEETFTHSDGRQTTSGSVAPGWSLHLNDFVPGAMDQEFYSLRSPTSTSWCQGPGNPRLDVVALNAIGDFVPVLATASHELTHFVSGSGCG